MPAETAESERIIEAAIRLELGKPEGPITDDDRLGLTELHLSGTAIADLTPLVKLRQLQGLNLSRCARIEDLSPLERLPHLVYLDLTGCSGLKEIPAGLRARSGLKIIGH